MGGSQRITRLAYVWGLIVCGTAMSVASAQELKKQAPRAAVVQSVTTQSSDTTTRRAGPFIPERFQQVQPASQNNVAAGLNDSHTVVVSTLVLILAAVIVLLLVL